MSNPLRANADFSLELAKDVASIECSHCGKQMTSVCGFITRDGYAYSTYFALLHTGHDEPLALLTISIGKWWDDGALNERHWAALAVQPSDTQLNMRIEEPQKSRHSNWKPLGIPMNRNEVLTSPLKSAFFEVADYIVENDPAVDSYLNGRNLDLSRGQRSH
jgi:hypothetical protein